MNLIKEKDFLSKKGLLSSLGTHVVLLNGDLEYNPNDLLKLQKMFVDFDADGVIGSRFNYSDCTRTHNLLNKLGNKILTFIFNVLYNTIFTDIYSCYFALKKKLLNINELRRQDLNNTLKYYAK